MTSTRQFHRIRLGRSLQPLALLCGVMATFLTASGALAANPARRPIVDGYDVVELRNGKLIRGRSAYFLRHDLRTYYFASRQSRQLFRTDPGRYAPVLNGDCVVCYARSGKRVPGTLKFAARHDGRLYLFPSARLRDQFRETPGNYENIDLAVHGQSVVWLAHTGRRVPGNSELTVRFDGFRYQFASARDRFEFLRRRKPYADFVMERTTQPRPRIPRSASTPAVPTVTSRQPSDRLLLSSLAIAQGRTPSASQRLNALNVGLTPQLRALRVLEAAN